MSRGPGRLQRAILDVLTDAQAPPGPAQYSAHDRVREQGDDELTTHHIHWALYDRGWPRDNQTFERQVRRALDRLHATGQVEKRLVPNWPYCWYATRSLWRLPRAR